MAYKGGRDENSNIHESDVSRNFLVGKKKDLKLVDSIAQKYRMSAEDRFRFGDEIHELKNRGDMGSRKNGDFTYHELKKIARNLIGITDE